MRADCLLFGLELTDRQMAVGDVIRHPEYGKERYGARSRSPTTMTCADRKPADSSLIPITQ